jgi:hypothetical protein
MYAEPDLKVTGIEVTLAPPLKKSIYLPIESIDWEFSGTYTFIDTIWPVSGFITNDAPFGNERSNPMVKSSWPVTVIINSSVNRIPTLFVSSS